MEQKIAIIGMACRVAGANSPTELWENLLASKDVQRRICRFNIDGFYHSEGGSEKGLTDVQYAYTLDDDAVDKFDNAFFFTNSTEAIAMDPKQRMLLEVSYEAIENAGIPLDRFVGTNTAVFTGSEGSDYHTVLARNPDMIPTYIVTGTAGCMASNRLSYFYDLSSPSMSVDTACSSSMAALNQAVRTLQHGDSTMALVCGANLFFNPESFLSMSKLGFLSASGRCCSFDASAGGYGRGEGIGVLVLKPLEKAIADHDPIRAIIRGTRLNQDGRTQGITLPSAEAQQQNMKSLYKDLAIHPSLIQYLEAHGTGTAAGDPLEMQAIQAVYSKSPLIIGSVKSSIGHCEAASALMSLIKTVLCLENAKIPAQMHFSDPNPAINFGNCTVPTNILDWPDTKGQVRRAGINTFGAGGTNGHAVLEIYESPCELNDVHLKKRPWLFKLSAADEVSLQALTKLYASYIKRKKPGMRDLAHTLVGHRSNLKYSHYYVESSYEEFVARLQSDQRVVSKPSNPIENILFVFTGQGAQWARMGYALLDHSPLFRSVLDECENILHRLPNGPSWSIIEELAKAKDVSNINEAEYSQPLCTVLQIGIVCLLQSWGIRPNAVVGHSSGEICAAFAAGMITMRSAILIAYYRGYVLANSSALSPATSVHGSMCAIGLSEEESLALVQEFDSQAQIAAVNSPRSCTLSGDRIAIQSIVEKCAKKGHFCRQLKVDKAYHSNHMLPLASRYQNLLQDAMVGPSGETQHCQLFSSVTGNVLRASDLTPSYWASNLTSTVRFASAVVECIRKVPGVNTVLEVGPHPALRGPVQEIFRSSRTLNAHFFSTCERETDDFKSILKSIGEMIVMGMPLDLCAVNAEEIYLNGMWNHKYGNTLTDLPTYQWNHSASFWFESRASRSVRFRSFPRHELLGSQIVDDISPRACWQNHLHLTDIPWLAAANLEAHSNISSAIYIVMAMEAARQCWAPHISVHSAIQLRNFRVVRSIDFPTLKHGSGTIAIQLQSRMELETKMSVEIHCTKIDSPTKWNLCCSGIVELIPEMSQGFYPDTWESTSDPILLRKARILYPEPFETVEGLDMSSGKIRGTTKTDQIPSSFQEYPVHPVILESILSLGPLSLFDRNRPVYHCVKSIETFQMRFNARENRLLKFAVNTNATQWGRAVSSIEVLGGIENILIGQVCYSATELIPAKRTTSSLFFKPICLPDITKPIYTRSLTIQEVIQRLSHKWPMSDIAIEHVSVEAQGRILETLHEAENSRIKAVQELTPGSGGHLIFASQDHSLQSLGRYLQPSGLACFRNHSEHLDKGFTYVCQVTGLDEAPWALWQKEYPITFSTPKQRIIFNNQKTSIKGHLHLNLTPSEVRAFTSRYGKERFDAVLFDDPDSSIILKWPGKDLIPWLRYLMEHAESLLWITTNASSLFNNVTGTLLRTLQAEQPSLKVCWLVVNEVQIEDASLAAQIENAYSCMLQGDNELRVEIDKTKTGITRYLPDKDLSSATGVSIPQVIQDDLVGKDYFLALTAPKEPMVLSYRSAIPASSQNASYGYANDEHKSPQERKCTKNEVGTARVLVMASLIGSHDVAAYEGIEIDQSGVNDGDFTTPQALGTFFAGKVLDSATAKLMPGSLVVGWTRGASANTLDVPEYNLYPAKGKDQSQAVAEFASLATAMVVVDGHIRARKEDSFTFVNVHGMLHEAFSMVCQELQVAVPEYRNPRSTIFTIELSSSGRLIVNNIPVQTITKYLATCPASLAKVWTNHKDFSSSCQRFGFKDYKDAFIIASREKVPVVLIHGDISNVPHIPIYRPPSNLASEKGAFIIIGGLGGLGRYVCFWLVSQGATSIYTISRSGISSPEAQELKDSLNSLPSVSLQVVRADACNRSHMSSIIASIRAREPIKGVINMAMVLGDAPIASMTGEEWERALRVKIDSSWLLHELTLEDDLDIFLLFSSIASVLGNRGQGGYNVGNAFLNALAIWRRKQGLIGVAIALGAMIDIGVLASIPAYLSSSTTIPERLTRSGLSHLTTPHLSRILEAAFLKFRRQKLGTETVPEEALIVTGLEMFEKEQDGSIAGTGKRIFWTELPEFRHLSWYRAQSKGERDEGAAVGLKVRVGRMMGQDRGGMKEEVRALVQRAFLRFLSSTLGFEPEAFDLGNRMGMYGLDSLGASGCQYWCWRELGVDVSVKEVFDARSIDAFLEMISERAVRNRRGETSDDVVKGADAKEEKKEGKGCS